MSKQSTPVSLSPAQPKKLIKFRNSIGKALSLLEVSSENGGKWGSADVSLTVAAPDGFRVPMEVHREVFVRRSRFFAEKLPRSGSHVLTLDILESDDLEVFVEALLLMYSDSEDLEKKLSGQEVSKVLQLLKVCSDILFDDGVTACLEYFEDVSKDVLIKVAGCLYELHPHNYVPIVPQGVVAEPSTSSTANHVFLKMSDAILDPENNGARGRTRMQDMICRLLSEKSSENSSYTDRIDISKETLYRLCYNCLGVDENRPDQGVLMREAFEVDNLEWIVDILIDRQIGEEFVLFWADQKELALEYSTTITLMHKRSLSKITAQLCTAIGRGQILVPKETRHFLLSTWFEALCEDFATLNCRSIDKKQVEEGLNDMILTMSLQQQEDILLKWFYIYLNEGDACPNLERTFEIWWRRSFAKQWVINCILGFDSFGVPFYFLFFM